MIRMKFGRSGKKRFTFVADKHAPFITKRQRKRKSPWMTATIKRHMLERDQPEAQAVTSNDAETWREFKNVKTGQNAKLSMPKLSTINNILKPTLGTLRSYGKLSMR